MLDLNYTYTFEEAIKAWSTDAFEVLCDNQFVVFPDVILCFFTATANSLKTNLVSPSRLLWAPARLDYDKADHVPWLPTKVRDVYNSETIRHHHMLIRGDVADPFFYGGQARLASYGSSNVPPKQFAIFSLYNELPRNVWLKLGAHVG